MEQLSESPVVFTNLETLEEQEVSLTDGTAAAVLAAGVVLTTGLLVHLIAMGIAFILAGVIVVTVAFIAKNSSSRNKSYNHFAVEMPKTGKHKGKLVVLGGISYKKAVSRLVANGDVWSVSSSLALKIGKAASPLGKTTSSELHGGWGSGYFRHYHPAYRLVWGKYTYRGSHSFYGEPA